MKVLFTWTYIKMVHAILYLEHVYTIYEMIKVLFTLGLQDGGRRGTLLVIWVYKIQNECTYDNQF